MFTKIRQDSTAPMLAHKGSKPLHPLKAAHHIARTSGPLYAPEIGCRGTCKDISVAESTARSCPVWREDSVVSFKVLSRTSVRPRPKDLLLGGPDGMGMNAASKSCRDDGAEGSALDSSCTKEHIFSAKQERK
jgi:hypothetical protein